MGEALNRILFRKAKSIRTGSIASSLLCVVLAPKAFKCDQPLQLSNRANAYTRRPVE